MDAFVPSSLNWDGYYMNDSKASSFNIGDSSSSASPSSATNTNDSTSNDLDRNSSLLADVDLNGFHSNDSTTKSDLLDSPGLRKNSRTNATIDVDPITVGTLAVDRSLVTHYPIKGAPTEEDWNLYKDRFAQLYKTRKLSEVMRIMKDEYGFIASTKMYKNRISKWGLNTKNNRECEMRSAIYKYRERKSLGLPTTFRIRGKNKDIREIFHYWGRKGVAIDDILLQRPPTPPGVECWTPPPSPVMTPRGLAGAESILKAVKIYMQGSLEARTWTTCDSGALASVKDPTGDAANELDFMFNHLQTAAMLMLKKAFPQAGRALVASTNRVEKIILAEIPAIVTFLLRLLVDLEVVNMPEVGCIVIKYFHDMAEIRLPRKHPLLQVCAQLYALASDQKYDVLGICFKSVVDNFESLLGPCHTTAMAARTDYIKQIGERWDLDRKESALRTLHQRCKSLYRPQHRNSVEVSMTLAWCLFDRSDFPAVVTIAQGLITSFADTPRRDFYCCSDVCGLLALSYDRMGENVLAERYLKESIDAYVQNGGSWYGKTINLMVQVERYLEKWGKPDAATQIWETKIEAQNSYQSP